MAWLLNLTYLLLLAVLSPWLLWSAWRRGKYRQGWTAKFLGFVPRRTGAQDCLWFHAVSLGEVNLLGTLLAEVAELRPDVCCYITATTLTGYQAAQRKYPQYLVSYCPLDFSWAVRRAVRRIRPTVLVLAELELWPNLIAAVKQSDARVAIVNGRLSERSFRGYRRLGWLARRMLSQVDLIAAQSQEYADRFLCLGARPDRTVVTGSLKFDGASTQRQNSSTRQLARLAQIDPNDVVWVAGSTFLPEEQVIVDVFRELAPHNPRLRLVIVPRHPERFEDVAEILGRSGLPFSRRSQLSVDRECPERMLLVDSVGELAAWWGLATIGYVGGSLGKRGGQNMIEPAGYGVAICFGPRTENFRDVVQAMLGAEAAQVVSDGTELRLFVQNCLDHPEIARRQGQRARALVLQNQGATGRTAHEVLSLIEGAPLSPQALRRPA